MWNALDCAVSKIQEGVDFVMVTIVEVEGSAPGIIGARMLVFDDDLQGTVGGGALEKLAIEQARALATGTGGAKLVKFKTADIGMNCGGNVTLFIEPFRVQPQLWLFGGGHIALALTPIAASLGFRVVVADNRAEFAQKERFSQAIATHTGPYAELAGLVPPGSYAVIATHGHMHDSEVLAVLAQRNDQLPYIGMIGSRRKVPTLLEELASRGIIPSANFYSPVGLDLGGGTPTQIAVSIAAELLAVLHGKTELQHNRLKLKGLTQK